MSLSLATQGHRAVLKLSLRESYRSIKFKLNLSNLEGLWFVPSVRRHRGGKAERTGRYWDRRRGHSYLGVWVKRLTSEEASSFTSGTICYKATSAEFIFLPRTLRLEQEWTRFKAWNHTTWGKVKSPPMHKYLWIISNSVNVHSENSLPSHILGVLSVIVLSGTLI